MNDPTEPDLGSLAEAAFRQAAVKVVLLARRTGTPVVVWKDGVIQHLDPNTIDPATFKEPPKPK